MQTNSGKTRQPETLALSFIPLAIAINIGIGALIKALNLPLYLDSVGTIIATLLLGWKRGATVGVVGFLLTALFFNPLAIYFCGTQLAIALFVDFAGKRGWFGSLLKTIISGAVLGIVSAIVSAPVIIYLFNGATGNGAALVTSFFVKMGNQIINSVLLSGFSVEPIDKCLQCALAFIVLKGIPKSFLERFTGGALKENNFY